jgi:hypothetical protein
MSEVRSNKIALFIDGANLHFAAKALGFDIDYGRLLQEFRKRGALIRAYYYTALTENEDLEANCFEMSGGPTRPVRSGVVCTENLNPNVLTMKSAQYGARIYDAGSPNLARDRRILVQ